MTNYPLKVRVKAGDFSGGEQPPSSSEVVTDARRSDGQYFILEPFTGIEVAAYDSIDEGLALHDTSRFYWVEEVIEGD